MLQFAVFAVFAFVLCGLSSLFNLSNKFQCLTVFVFVFVHLYRASLRAYLSMNAYCFVMATLTASEKWKLQNKITFFGQF